MPTTTTPPVQNSTSLGEELSRQHSSYPQSLWLYGGGGGISQFPLQWICTDVSKGGATESWQNNWLKLNVLWKHKLWRRQAYHQDLRPGVYTLSRVRQTIVEKVYLFLFSDCVQEWTFLKHRKRNRALYNMAVIYLEVPVLRTLKYYQSYNFMCLFLWKWTLST